MVIPQLLHRQLLVLEVGTVGAVFPPTAVGWGERSVLAGNTPDHGWMDGLSPFPLSQLRPYPQLPATTPSAAP